MKTPDEIKKGMGCCARLKFPNAYCDNCPYLVKAAEHLWECKSPEILTDALAYIQQLEAQVPKWISVEERLPDDLEEVLILVKETEFYGQYKEFSKSYFCQYIGCVDDGEWFTVWCHGHRYIKDTAKEPYADKFEVTHWMPLPSTEEINNDT